MFFQTAILLSIGLTSVLAAPMRYSRLEDLQCRCLTFSTSAAPTICTYQELLTLDWETAYSLASANRIKIQFASSKTTTKVLSLPRPVPTSILETLQEGEARPLDPSKKVQHENRIICGFGDEIEHVRGPGKSLTPEIHYVGTVLGLFMLLLIIYLAAEYVWTEFAARARSVRLEGDEKTLSADFEPSTPTEKSEHVAYTAPMDCH